MSAAGEQHFGEQMRDRVEALEKQAELDRQLIEHLQFDATDARSRIAHLEKALETSRRIGAAIGILMATHRITDETAFQLLQRASQKRNQKLRDLAEDVLLTGTL